MSPLAAKRMDRPALMLPWVNQIRASATSPILNRGNRSRARRSKAVPTGRSSLEAGLGLAVDTLFVKPLIDLASDRVEAAVLESLLELDLDQVPAAPVLLDRADNPIAELLRLVGVEDDVVAIDDLPLVIHDYCNVGFVKKCR
jgi:hypothetical protein